MHRIDTATKAADLFGAGKDGFRNGNKAAGISATDLTAAFFNDIQENIAQVVEGAGIALVKGDYTQLKAAIQQMIVNGGAIKTPVRLATTANIANLAAGAPSTLDGVAPVVNDRILVKDQATASQNGIYVVTTVGTGANGAWTRAGDADGNGELFAGLLVVVAEGTAGADSIWEVSTDGALVIGTTSISFARKDLSLSASVQGGFKNLQLSAGGAAASISVSYDELVLGDGSGNYITERNVSGTITTTNTGAGGLDTGALAASTWYSIWRIGKTDGTRAFLFSLSATAPTLPAGYTYKARVGWFRTDGSGNKYPLAFIQLGRRVQYKIAAGTNLTVLPTIASGVQGSASTPTWVACAVGAFVPSTADLISLSLGCGSAGGIAGAAPNNVYGAYTANGSQPPLMINTVSISACNFAEFSLESSNIYYYSANSAVALQCLGWEDNL